MRQRGKSSPGVARGFLPKVGGAILGNEKEKGLIGGEVVRGPETSKQGKTCSRKDSAGLWSEEGGSLLEGGGNAWRHSDNCKKGPNHEG